MKNLFTSENKTNFYERKHIVQRLSKYENIETKFKITLV